MIVIPKIDFESIFMEGYGYSYDHYDGDQDIDIKIYESAKYDVYIQSNGKIMVYEGWNFRGDRKFIFEAHLPEILELAKACQRKRADKFNKKIKIMVGRE